MADAHSLPARPGTRLRDRQRACLVYDTVENAPMIDLPEGLSCIALALVPPP